MAKYFVKDGEAYVPVDDNLLTQPDVDTIVEKRLERERSKFADYDSLKETAGKVNTIKSEFEEKLKTEADVKADLEKQLGNAKLETVKVKAIHEFKLSDEAAEFVTGENADEIRTRAEKLSKVTSGGGGINLNKNEKPDEKPSNSKTLAGKLFGNKSD